MLHPSTVILSAVRTPLGTFQGALASLPAPRLGAAAIKGAVERAGVAPDEVADVFFGHVLQAGAGQAPARQAALFAGLPSSTRCSTINKVCGSGLEAILQAHRAIALGEATLAVAGGMESMSSAPYLLPKIREGYRLGHRQTLDALVHDGLWDPHHQKHMGNCAERCANQYSFTRQQQDAYAAESFRRANAAQKEGRLAAEIVPVELPELKGKPNVTQDEGPARVNYDKMPTLRPAFAEDGTITAANASTLNDGAAALVLADRDHAEAHGLKPIARIVSHGSFSHDPLWFTTAPVDAARNALTLAGWTTQDVELWEVNEAFAVVPMAFARELSVPADRLNVHGGAIALGHPLGASGARIVVTLLSALRQRGAKRGLAAICIGGGEGLALCVELL